MLTRFEVNDFGCLRAVALDLTPIHAFIGPNDSGKSTLLRAIGTLCHVASPGYANEASNVVNVMRPPEIEHPTRDLWLAGRVGASRVELWTQPAQPSRFELFVDGSSLGATSVRSATHAGIGSVAAPAIVRFDPDALRRSSPIATDRLAFLESRGLGLPTMLLLVKGRDDDAWPAFRKRVAHLFPSVSRLDVKPAGNEMRLELTLDTGQRIGAEECSEGLLYYLAFACLGYLDAPSRVLLVEEPENGLHPARIREIVGLLRHLSENGVQVIMATHSPLVVNELRADEITLVTRDPKLGTQVTPIAKTPHFDERSQVYALGELWLSYADGKIEAPLLDETAAQ